MKLQTAAKQSYTVSFVFQVGYLLILIAMVTALPLQRQLTYLSLLSS